METLDLREIAKRINEMPAPKPRADFRRVDKWREVGGEYEEYVEEVVELSLVDRRTGNMALRTIKSPMTWCEVMGEVEAVMAKLRGEQAATRARMAAERSVDSE